MPKVITYGQLQKLYDDTYSDYPKGIYRRATFPYHEGSVSALCDALNAHFAAEALSEQSS
jgi:hypothetical protein